MNSTNIDCMYSIQLEGELRRFIPTWEAEHGRAFLVNGKRFLDDLDEKLDAELAEKESKKVRGLVYFPHWRSGIDTVDFVYSDRKL